MLILNLEAYDNRNVNRLLLTNYDRVMINYAARTDIMHIFNYCSWNLIQRKWLKRHKYFLNNI
jgi:hypothetical protein